MQLKLTGIHTIAFNKDTSTTREILPADESLLNIDYSAICKTDAKMWHEGHRDLIFPRVPGHEFVGVDPDSGQRYAVWPAKSCGTCVYCTTGRENLCDDIKIIGFHRDGGFSDMVLVPTKSLIPVTMNSAPYLHCFLEPIGCVNNVLAKVGINKGDSVIIYGAGTVGLITALLCKEYGAEVLLIERNEKKIDKAGDFLDVTGITCVKETNSGDFDIAINACADFSVFPQMILKLKKGGRLGFFSGLAKNNNILTNAINAAHYKEITIFGSYGLTKRNMTDGIRVIHDHSRVFEFLIEDIILPEKVPDVIEHVLKGEAYKYIINFRESSVGHVIKSHDYDKQAHEILKQKKEHTMTLNKYTELVRSIEGTNKGLASSIQHKIDNKTKPLGSLGILEEIALKVSLIQQNENPDVTNKSLFVFAADHGIAESGVSAFPQEVTRQMVKNFADGNACINVLCRQHNIDLEVIDVGVNADITELTNVIQHKIGYGTKSFIGQQAMTRDEAIRAVEAGMTIFFEMYEKAPIDILGLGEMGIANTTSASAIICAVTGLSPKEATGRGTGVDDKGLSKKIEVIQNALDFHQPLPDDPIDILCKVGGFEIAGICGACLAAASKNTIVVLDGLISTAGGLLSYLFNRNMRDYLLAGHKSVEIGHIRALSHIGIDPILDLGMRLGEGTGAALSMSLVESSCKVMQEMASFDDAGVSGPE